MTTEIRIDAILLNEVHRLSAHATPEGAVIQVLREFVQLHKQREIVNLFGTIDIDANCDHKEQRRQR